MYIYGFPIKYRNFGGNSPTTTNTETVTQPTSSTGTTGAGGTSNAISSTGTVNLDEESPQALNELGGAVAALQTVAGEAITASAEEATGTESLVGKNTESGTEQITPIVVVVALLGAFVAWSIYKRSKA
jgi:hypothetical protein